MAQMDLLEHPVSLASIQLAELALGDLHGSLAGGLAPDAGAIDGASISVGGLSMSLSMHGLSSRCAPLILRRSI